MLRVLMNEMKKKVQFIEKTDWMFNGNFDVKFLETYGGNNIDLILNSLMIRVIYFLLRARCDNINILIIYKK
jgi:hypothetical protein